MAEEKHIIWTNIDLNLDDWYDDLHEQYPALGEEGLRDMMNEINFEDFGDVQRELDMEVGSPILVLADLGLWDGRHTGYREIESGNLKDCMETDYDLAEWYVDENGEFGSRQIHHDGTNYYRYRRYLPDATEDQIDDLKEKLYNGTASEEDLDAVTEPLGSLVGAVYGWENVCQMQ